MRALGENPFEAIGENIQAYETLLEKIEPEIIAIAEEYDRPTAVMAMEDILSDLRNRNGINTYDVSDEIFEELLEIKYNYDIDIRTCDVTIEQFVQLCKRGNPLMASKYQWVTVEKWEEQWERILQLREEHGDVILETFFDLVIQTEQGYHERKMYVDALMEEI